MGRIDLTKVPENKLITIAEANKINFDDCKSLNLKRHKLLTNLSKDKLLEYTSDYIYGGKTSIIWYKYFAEDNIEKPINKDNIVEIIKYLCDGENPFENERQPELSKIPQIINARFLNDSNVLIEFSAKGREREIWVNYELLKISPTETVFGIFKLDDNIFEIRSKINLAKTTVNNMIMDLARDSRYKHTFNFLNLTEEKLIKLKDELNANMVDFVGVDDSGDYAWRGYGVPLNEDMWVKPKFQKDKEGMISPKSRLAFPSLNDSDYLIQFRASTITGGISFINHYVSEYDLNFIYNALKKIKFVEG